MENGGTLLNKKTKNQDLAKVKVEIRTEPADIVKQVDILCFILHHIYEWLNISFESFKVKCKDIFLN